MSSSESESQILNSKPRSKSTKPRRKLHSACDFCRGRKTKCDGHDMPGKRCTNCRGASIECTYNEAAKGRISVGYVQTLESRLETLEHLLNTLSANQNSKSDSCSADADTALNVSNPNFTIPIETDVTNDFSSGDEQHGSVPKRTPTTEIDLRLENRKYMGRSAGWFFVQDIREMKNSMKTASCVDGPYRRPGIWDNPPWEEQKVTIDTSDSDFQFPEPSMISSLVELYFLHVNLFYPLLHRPTFEHDLAIKLHMRDDGFGSTVILVCAIGCRFSEDPSIYSERSSSSKWPMGWQLFYQIRRLRRLQLPPRSLYDLQAYILAAIFLEESSPYQGPWILIGAGLRFVQEIGAHRRRVYGPKPAVETEPWKRAFWVLMVLDRFGCLDLGRPCALQDEDFDVELPIECDDEYWSHLDPEEDFKQPLDKPSKMTFFITLIKLSRILAFALRTIYSIKKSGTPLDSAGIPWDERIVSQLESALKRWVDSMPPCLRWDKSREELAFFRQSVLMYSRYYQIQIAIHRLFISHKFSSMSTKSMAICSNAARSCSLLVDRSQERMGLAIHNCMSPIFTSALILLLDLWIRKKAGNPTDSAEETEEVYRCQSILKSCETRWTNAGRKRELLASLQSPNSQPFYRYRDEKGKREYLFVPNYASLGLKPLSSPSAAGIQEDQLVALDGPSTALGVEEALVDSERLTRLPSHLEALFSEPSPSSQEDENSTGSGGSIPGYHIPANSTGVIGNDTNSLVPVELLMYNDLMGSRNLMEWSSIAGIETENQAPFSEKWF